MISSTEGFWALLYHWKSSRVQVDVTVTLHRGSDKVLMSTLRGYIDNTENNTVMISADDLNIIEFNVVDAKLLVVTMSELEKTSKSYADQLRNRQHQSEFIEPFLLLFMHEDSAASVTVMINALRPATVQ
jgi:hypothetical protein